VTLPHLANQTGLRISVCHCPPRTTSKGNKIEHRLFSHISMNWRGKPLYSHAVVVNLIASTTTRTGLKIEAELDANTYPKGIQVTDEELGSRTAGMFHLKQDPGGIADIEFMVQYAVLAHAHRYPALLTYTDNIRQLDGL
jgi:hypothetical protein